MIHEEIKTKKPVTIESFIEETLILLKSLYTYLPQRVSLIKTINSIIPVIIIKKIKIGITSIFFINIIIMEIIIKRDIKSIIDMFFLRNIQNYKDS